MKSFAALAAVFLTVFALVAEDAQAARMGGGRSVGRQSSNVTQRQATPAQSPQQAATPASAAAARPAAPPPAAPQPARNRWLGPLAGLAAGLGLAALASHFGFGEGLASFMMIALFAMAAFFVIRMVMARRSQAQSGPQPAFQSAYSPGSVGAEAAVSYAPPPVQMPGPGAGAAPAMLGSTAAPATPESSWQVPPDFDRDGFLKAAKGHFVRLQEAFDGSRLDLIREFTTNDLFDSLKGQIEERRGGANRTDVVRLDAELLGIEVAGHEYLASVRFNGMLREADGAPAENFDEVWNLVKPADGSGGWLLAGIQQLQ